MRAAIGLGSVAAPLATVPAQATMPFHAQRRGDLRQIIDMPALDRFGPITRIELIAPGLWRVTSGRCHIDVRMVERPGPYPRPRSQPAAARAPSGAAGLPALTLSPACGRR